MTRICTKTIPFSLKFLWTVEVSGLLKDELDRGSPLGVVCVTQTVYWLLLLCTNCVSAWEPCRHPVWKYEGKSADNPNYGEGHANTSFVCKKAFGGGACCWISRYGKHRTSSVWEEVGPHAGTTKAHHTPWLVGIWTAHCWVVGDVGLLLGHSIDLRADE